MQHDPVAAARELLGQRDELVMAAAAAGDQCRPRATFADDLVEDVDSANLGVRHAALRVFSGAVDSAPAHIIGGCWRRASGDRAARLSACGVCAIPPPSAG